MFEALGCQDCITFGTFFGTVLNILKRIFFCPKGQLLEKMVAKGWPKGALLRYFFALFEYFFGHFISASFLNSFWAARGREKAVFSM